MAAPLVQRIRSEYNSDATKRFIADLKEIRSEQSRINRTRSAAAGSGATQATKAQSSALKELRVTMAEAREEFKRLNIANRDGKISNEQFRAAVQKLTASVGPNIQKIRGGLKNMPREVATAFKQAENTLASYNARTREVATGTTRLGKRIGDAISSMATRIKIAMFNVAFRAIAGFGRAMRNAVAESAKFTSQLVESAAIMGNVTASQFKRMQDAAEQTSKELNLAAQDLAKGYFFLASAGLDVEQSIAALPEVALFAKAGMFDLASAVDLSTDALSALGLKSADAETNMRNLAHVQDVLVKANTIANATVEQFSKSITNKAGAAIRALNKDMEEGVAVLAAFADQGRKGEEAGTALDIVFRDLQNAAIKNADVWEKMGLSVFDSSGKFRNIADIIAELETRLEGASDKQKQLDLINLGFRQKSVQYIKSLLGMSDAIRGYETALRDAAGTTQEVADKQMRAPLERLGRFSQRLKAIFRETFGEVVVNMGVRLADAFEMVADKSGLMNERLTDVKNSMTALEDTAHLATIYEDLAVKTDRTKEEQAKLRDVTLQLAEIYPGYIKKTNDAGEAVELYADAIRAAIRAQKEQLLFQQRDALKGLVEEFRDASRHADGFRERLDKLEKQRLSLADGPQFETIGFGQQAKTVEVTAESIRKSVGMIGTAASGTQIKLNTATTALGAYFADVRTGIVDVTRLTQFIVSTLDMSVNEANRLAKDFADRYTALMKQVGQAKKDVDDIEVDGDGDGDEVLASIAAAGERAAKQMQKLRAEFDMRDAPEAIKPLLEKLEELDEQIVKAKSDIADMGAAKIDTTQAREDLARLERERAAILVEVQLEINTSAADVQLDALDQKIAETKSRIADMGEAMLDTTQAREDLERLQEERATLVVQLETDTDEADADLEAWKEITLDKMIAWTAEFNRALRIRADIDAAKRLTQINAHMQAITKTSQDLSKAQRNLKLAEGLRNPQLIAAARKEVEALADSLLEDVLTLLEKFGEDIPDEFKDQLLDMINRARNETQGLADDIAEAFDELADAGRSLVRMIDVFGGLSDGAKKFANGLFDAIDNAGNLIKKIQALKKEGDLLSAGGILSLVVPAVGVVSGIAGALGGIFGGGRSDAQRAEQERQKLEEIRAATDESVQAIRDNTRSITDRINELINVSRRIGADLTQAQARSAKEAFDAFLIGFEPLTDELARIMALPPPQDPLEAQGRGLAIRALQEQASDQFIAFIEQLERTGIIDTTFRDDILGLFDTFVNEFGAGAIQTTEALLAGGDTFADFIQGIIENTGNLTDEQVRFLEDAARMMGVGIRDLINIVAEDLGEFPATVEGALERFRVMSSLLNDNNKAIADFFAFIMDQEIVDPNSMLGGFLQQLIDAPDASARQAIFERIADLIGKGKFDYGDLTPALVDQILAPFRGLGDDVAQSGGDVSDRIADAFLIAEQAARDFLQFVDPADVQGAYNAFMQALIRNGAEFNAGMTDFIADFVGLDIDTDAGQAQLREILRAWGLELSSGGTAIRDALGLTEEEFRRLATNLSGYLSGIELPVESLDDAIRNLSLRLEILGTSASEALRLFLDDLARSGVDLPAAVQGLLDEAGGLNLSTAAGQARLQEIIQAITQMMIDNVISDETGQEIIDALQAIGNAVEQPPTEGEEQRSTNVQFLHTITVFQAAEIVNNTRHMAFRMDQILESHRTAVDWLANIAQLTADWTTRDFIPPSVQNALAPLEVSAPALSVFDSTGRVFNVTIGDIVFGREPTRDDIDMIAEALWEDVRRERERAS